MRLLLALIFIAPLLHAEVDTSPLEAWLKRQAGVRSLEADFIQERNLPSLTKPVTTPGTLTMTREGKLRWELGKPAKTIAISDGQQMTLIDVTKKQAQTLDRDSARARPFTVFTSDAMGGGLEGFVKAFEPVESRVTQGIYQLTARPKDRSTRKQVEWFFFDIDPKRNELRAMEILLKDKTRIRTIFSNTKLNGKIDGSRFQFDLSDYKVR